MARENQTILDTWQTRGIKKKEGASQTYDTPSRFKTYVKFAEYYKSVTKIKRLTVMSVRASYHNL